MLTIRSTQLRALSVVTAHEAIPLLVEHARRFHEERFHAAAPEHPERFVRQVVDAALDYGIEGPRALARFLDLALVAGFPLPPAFDRVLRTPANIAPTRRLDRAWRRLLFQLEAGQ
jgi:hypothetical protein